MIIYLGYSLQLSIEMQLHDIVHCIQAHRCLPPSLATTVIL